jgi:hypothetical protein
MQTHRLPGGYRSTPLPEFESQRLWSGHNTAAPQEDAFPCMPSRQRCQEFKTQRLRNKTSVTADQPGIKTCVSPK